MDCTIKMDHLFLVVISSLLMLIGIAGTVIPILPSISFMFLVALAFGFLDHFEHLSTVKIFFLGVLTVTSIVVDYGTGILGAKYFGATKYGIIGGVAGLFLGLLLFPPFGALMGLFIGTLIAEIIYGSKYHKALRIASGTFLGSIVAVLINLFLGITFLVLFIIFSI